ncbi:MAG: hypothetical protein QW210_04595, partial [Candidatus Woesearchaeota archaeon]
MNFVRSGLIVFLVVFLSIISIVSINAKWCAYYSSEYLGCFELSDCSAIEAVEVSQEDCEAPVCCVVKDSSNKEYYGTVLSLATQKTELFDGACKNINKIISTYSYVSSTTYENSICQKFNLLNNPGFHDLSSLGCFLNVRFSINDEKGPLLGTLLEYFQIEENTGNILYTVNNQVISSSQYSLNYFIPKKCDQISRTIKLKIKITKSGYDDYFQEMQYTLRENIDKIELLDLFNVVMKKQNNWEVTFNFQGIPPDELKDGFFITYVIGSQRGQVFVKSDTDSATAKIPKPSEMYSGNVNFVVNLPKYATNSFSEYFSSNIDTYVVNVPPFRFLDPITKLKIILRKGDISGCTGSIIGAVSTSFYYASFQLLYNSLSDSFEAIVPIYSQKSISDMTSNNEKEFTVNVLCREFMSSITRILEPVEELTIIMPKLENKLADCRVSSIVSGLVNKESLCQKPCRKYYTFNCSTSICSFSNEDWNLVKNQPHLGLCDNGFTCDALGNCVPVDDYCEHKNSVSDCINVNINDGFYYCDETNKKIFVNLTKLYNDGNYDAFVFYCQKCSFDNECRTCNNPNSVLGNKLGRVCNVTTNSICNDRLITKDDLNVIAGGSVPSIYVSKNLNDAKQYYDYCVANNCGLLDSDCNKTCDSLSDILSTVLGVSLVCDAKENLSQVFLFGNCSSSSLFCGISKTSICLGYPVLNIPTYENYIYLVESRGGTILTNLGIRCSSVPIPLSLPEIGQTNKPLKELLFEELNNPVKEALNNNRDYFNANRNKVYGVCYGQIMHFNEEKYCCFNGPSLIPCENPLDLTINVTINYSGTLDKGKNLVFKINDLNANSEFLVTTNDEGIVRMLIPRRHYNFTVLHDLFNYSNNFDLTKVLGSTYPINIVLNVPGNYRKLEGTITHLTTGLKNIDVNVIFGYFNMFQYTDNQGKFNFGYFNLSLLENVSFEVNHQYSNPFFIRKTIQNVNFSDSSTNPLPYIINLNTNGNVNLLGYVTDNSNRRLNGIRITVLGLEQLRPSTWFSDYKFKNISFNGTYELKRLPCNDTYPVPLKILFEHEDYLPKIITFNSNCAITELNVTLQEKSCLKQEVTPENINLSIDNDGNLTIRWKFKCSPYVLGFSIDMIFIDRSFIIADLVESNHSRSEYEYTVNLNDLGLLDYAGIRNQTKTITIFPGQVSVTALWEKPFVNKTSKTNSQSLSFDYGCVKRFWYDKVPGQVLKFVLNYTDISYANEWTCQNGTYINNTGYNASFSKYLQNKTNPYFLSNIYFVNLTAYQNVNKYDIKSQFCSGPFLAFGTYFADKCKDLPLTKSYGLLYYYKSCVNVRNCYDYNTKTACLENVCLPFECEWRMISEINSSYALYPSKASNLGVCVPKDPVLVDCSIYNLDIDSEPQKFDLVPFMFNKNDIRYLSEENPYFNISRIAELFGQSGNKQEGFRRCIFNSGGVFDNSTALPKHVKFVNKFYYKSIEDLRNYVKDRKNYGIFDYDLIFDNNDQTYTFNYNLLDINNSLPNIAAGLPGKKYSLRNINDFINLTNLSVIVKEGTTVASEIKSIIVIDPDEPLVNNLIVSLIYYYTAPNKQFSYYALKLILNISNEDWVVAEGKITPIKLFLPSGKKESGLSSYKILDNFSLETDGIFNYIEKPIFRMKYESREDISELAIRDYNSKIEMVRSQLGSDYELNTSLNEFLLVSGVYNLSLTLRDKLNNVKIYNFQINLPKNGVFFKTGYYKY